MPAFPTNIFLDDGTLILSDSSDSKTGSPQFQGRVGILIGNLVNRRLIEAASIHIGLFPTLLEGSAFDIRLLHGLELIVADEPLARAI